MKKIERTIESLEKNGFKVYKAKDKEEGKKIFLYKILPEINPKVISYGDSMTLKSTGIIKELKLKNDIKFIDTFDVNTSHKEQIKSKKNALSGDLFITGSNALTESGLLVNLDMIGNRIAGIVFGPRKVVLLIGKNKITKNLKEAMERVKKIAPQNAQRHLKLDVPCQKTGICVNCSSPHRICNSWLITEKSYPKDRIIIILIEEDLGL